MHNTKPTVWALRLKWALQKLGIKDVRTELWDGHKHIDLAIPSAHMDIEIDGSQHSTDANQILADFKRAHYSDLQGYDTKHVTNEELRWNLWGTAKAIANAARIQRRRLREKFRKYRNK